MGWFTQSSEDKRASEIRSGTVAPSRTERQKCWDSRDAYFTCLDRNEIIDPVKNEKEAPKPAAPRAIGWSVTALRSGCV